MTTEPSPADFSSQVLASATGLGARYHVDEAHARRVARLAIQLFDSLAAEHALKERDRLRWKLPGFCTISASS